MSECGKLVKMMLNFLYAMKLDIGSIVHPNTWHYSLKVWAFGMNVLALGTLH
jgi:hypothetical protein